MQQQTLEAATIRPVSQDDVDFFFEHGWVHIRGLVDPGTTAALLERAKGVFGADGMAGLEREAAPASSYASWFRSNYQAMGEEDYAALGRSAALGRDAALLLGRDSPIRRTTHTVNVKVPAANGPGKGTGFHQDTSGHMYCDGNFLTVWVALDEVAADMGAMEFYSGSHKLGNLCSSSSVLREWAPVIERYCTHSGPIAMQPGDATFHFNNTIHGTAPNVSDRARWSYTAVLVPGDARYTGAANQFTDGLGLTPGGALDHPNLPRIYAPAGGL